MANPTPASADPHKKFKELSDKISSEDDANLVLGLEDTIYRTWALHTDQNKDAQGKDLAEKVYNSARGYITENMFPAYNTIKNDDNTIDALDGIIRQLIGIDKSGLEKRLKDKKVVHKADLAQETEKSKKVVSQYLQQMRMGRVQKFADEDLGEFKNYLTVLAKEAKVTDFDPNTIVGTRTATDAYFKLLNRTNTYKALDKNAKYNLDTAEEE